LYRNSIPVKELKIFEESESTVVTTLFSSKNEIIFPVEQMPVIIADLLVVFKC
jgi:hypothetical protein